MAQVKFVTWLAGLVNKPTPTDTDQMYVGDAGTSKYSTWAQVKATLKTYFDGLYPSGSGTSTGTNTGDQNLSTLAPKGLATASGLTSTTAKLLGRATAATGALEEITLGTNLSFTGSTLNAAGGGGGSPGGATTQVQFNDAGAFAGDAGFTWNKTSKALTFDAGTTYKAALTPQQYNALAVGSASNLREGQVNAASFNCFNGVVNDTQMTLRISAAAANVNVVLAVAMASNCIVGWTSITTSAYTAAFDTGLARNAAGVVEVNSGVPGTFRDLKLRNLIGTGNLATGIVAKVAAYTATLNDYAIECDATTAAFAITLFPAAGNAGKMLLIKRMNSGANDVTIDANASETIDGALTVALSAQYADITIQVNTSGTGWNKVSGV